MLWRLVPDNRRGLRVGVVRGAMTVATRERRQNVLAEKPARRNVGVPCRSEDNDDGETDDITRIDMDLHCDAEEVQRLCTRIA